MTCFVDTSAIYAVFDGDDAHHEAAREEWARLLNDGGLLATTSFVLVETLALLQRRLGMKAVDAFQEDIFPLLRIEWVERTAYEAGVTGILSAQRRDLSLVDCTSFHVMRRLGIRQAFAFDPCFAEQGFSCLPARPSEDRPT